ncbi:HNH endonuclease signature motif containing protein [Streptomyces sp. NPDC048256]|uniref:HNH endonuclease n=1 Tax=Streptomyces sp. NPDC048256 TaxID=3154613 RepID=UPI0033F02C97
MGRGRPALNRLCGVVDCGRPHRARGLCSTHWKRRHGVRAAYPVVECCVCGTGTPRTSTRERVVCSTECRWFLQWPQRECPVPWHECTDCGHRWIDRAVSSTCAPCRELAKTRRWIAGWCVRCGTGYVVADNRLQAKYCSRRCLRGDQKDRRRALQKEAFVAPVRRIAVFQRDRWICRLCSKPVVRTAVVPHPRAPVIDHVIPLARGGTHEPANVQTAHFLCNSIKSDRGGGEQLMLIG